MRYSTARLRADADRRAGRRDILAEGVDDLVESIRAMVPESAPIVQITPSAERASISCDDIPSNSPYT